MLLTREKPKLPSDIILTFDMQKLPQEKSESGPLDLGLVDGHLDLRDTIAAMDLASKDPRVKMVIARFRDDGAGYAEAQELRDAVYRMREKGKITYATATSFGELTPADKAFYIASAFEEIVLQPIGSVGLTGVVAQMPFFRGSLDKIGAQPDFVHREEYKTAMDSVAGYDFTEANAEMMESILNDISAQVVTEIAEDRDIEPLNLQKLIDKAPLTAEEAKNGGLIDRIGYFDEIADWACMPLANSELVFAEDYLHMRRAELRKVMDKKGPAPVIGHIHAVGAIVQDGVGADGISAADMADAIEQAVNDEDVEALLIRLDSPGGSAVASETIRYAVERARFAGLPVVVSMGGVAASGGYWIATEADKIIADPSTLTGSIGVIAGKVAGTDVLWDKLGINWGEIARGENADMWTITAPFTDAQRARVDELVGDTYSEFKSRVARGRELNMETVAALAKGRVWTGNQALELGLIDELGGFYDALQITKNIIGLTETDVAMVKEFPEEHDVLSRIKKSLAQFGGFGLSMQKIENTLDP